MIRSSSSHSSFLQENISAIILPKHPAAVSRCDRIKNMNGSSYVLYLILGIVGLSIVSYCLIQDTINKRVSQA